MCRHDHKVIEVSRADRRLRRLNGKSDTLDAKNAARAVCGFNRSLQHCCFGLIVSAQKVPLRGFAIAVPKSADGAVEMIRWLKVAHDTAVKDRAAAMVTLKAMLVHAPEELRRDTAHKTQKMIARHCAALRPRSLDTPEDANRHVLRSIAKRWINLNEEIAELQAMIKELVLRRAPHLLDEFGIGVDTAAEILIVAGDNPERIKSEAAFAKLARISPIPAGSGTTSGKHRINHGGHRQLNAAIYRTVIVRMRFHEPTIAYVARRTAQGKSKRDIIRCLKRYVIREVYHLIKTETQTGKIAS